MLSYHSLYVGNGVVILSRRNAKDVVDSKIQDKFSEKNKIYIIEKEYE